MESIASRYALALYKLAEESKDMTSFLSRLMDIEGLIQTDANFLSLLKNPFYTVPQKMALLDAVFTAKEDAVFLGFFRLLLRNHRLRYVPAILLEAIRLTEYALGMRSGTLYTATLMTDTEKQAIEKALSDQLHVSLSLIMKHQPSLIGGFRVDIDGKVYDASLLGKLEGLKSHLKKRGSQ